MTHHLHPIFPDTSLPAAPDILIEKQKPLQEEADLNEIVNGILHKYLLANSRTPAILRLDKLAVVTGKNEHLTFLFEELIYTIFNHPPSNSKLLLYVQCAKKKADDNILDLRHNTSGSYIICFHTNINTDENWKALYKLRLEDCCRITQECGGSLSYYNITNTGCLFSLTLPGKTT